MPDLVIRKEGPTYQPNNCLEGLWSVFIIIISFYGLICRAGFTRCGINLGVTTANILYKPISASHQHCHERPRRSSSSSSFCEEKSQITRCGELNDQCVKGCCLGCGSSIAGLLGVASSALLCTQLASTGALHHICNVSFLCVVRDE